MSDRLFIFDTTLRDGEQVPGCQLNTVEKIQVAKHLEALESIRCFFRADDRREHLRGAAEASAHQGRTRHRQDHAGTGCV